MKKVLLLLLIIAFNSCSPSDNEENIQLPKSPEEIAAEAAQRASDSLLNLYGSNIENSNLQDVVFLFRSNDNTYLSGQINQELWIGVFSENLSNKGEATVPINHSSEINVRYQKHHSIEDNYFFSLYIMDSEHESDMFNFPHTRLIIKHHLENQTIKALTHFFEANEGEEVVNIRPGYNNGYLIYTAGYGETYYANSLFDNSQSWGGTYECFPDQGDFTFVNEKVYIYSDDYSLSGTNLDGCKNWEVTVLDIFQENSCINCNYSFEVVQFSETEIQVKASLLGDQREALINPETGEIESITEL